MCLSIRSTYIGEVPPDLLMVPEPRYNHVAAGVCKQSISNKQISAVGGARFGKQTFGCLN